MRFLNPDTHNPHKKFLIPDTQFIRTIFFVIAFVNLLAIGFDIFWLKALTKPFILLGLMTIYSSSFFMLNAHNSDFYEKYIDFDKENIYRFELLCSKLEISIKSLMSFSLALVFCLLGDILLLFDSTFLLGLISFLMAHISFWSDLWGNSLKKEGLVIKNKILILPFIAYLAILLYYIFPHIKNDLVLQIAVVIYGGAISISGILALNRFGFVSKDTFALVFVGFLFFIASDTWIALQKFVFKTNHTFDNLMIMITYIIALFLIVQGFIVQKISEMIVITEEHMQEEEEERKPKNRNTKTKKEKEHIEMENMLNDMVNGMITKDKKPLTNTQKKKMLDEIRKPFLK